MQAKGHTSFTGRLFSLFLAIYVLNFSVDLRDAHPAYVAENLEHNEIESFVEFVLEVVLGHDGALAEYDEPEKDDGSSLSFQFYFARSQSALPESPAHVLLVSDYFPNDHDFLQDGFLETKSPPPKA